MSESFILKFTITVLIFNLVVSPIALFADNLPPTTKTVSPHQQSADLSIGIIETHPCLCFEDLKELNVLIPNNMKVHVYNNSSLIVNAKVTIRYFSLKRELCTWKTWTYNITLNPHQTQVVAVWNDVYYDIIGRGSKITAKVEITSTNIVDSNLTNNERAITDCEYYIG
ncbi:MAG: hypothetical protein JW737_04790 [Acidobacteria bacterium]|nr:hypothetical protein [Acidobacteriota bacterium]